MTIIKRHSTGSFELWQSNYDSCVTGLSSILTELPQMPEAIGSLTSLAAERAALASLRNDGKDEICASLQIAAQTAAAAFLSARCGVGQVRLTLGLDEIQFPATGPISTAHFGIWLLGLSSSVICRESVAKNIICHEDSVNAAMDSATSGDDFWSSFAQVIISTINNDISRWRSSTGVARSLMNPNSSALINPKFVEYTKLPLLDLCDCLMEGREDSWSDALLKALEKHRIFWSSSNNADDSFGFLALDIAAMCVLAYDRGWRMDMESEYIPKFLIKGGCSATGTKMAYVYPCLNAQNVEEMHLYMDAQGCQKYPRTHRMVEHDGRLVATYECESIDGSERKLFEFEYPDSDKSELTNSKIIDAGEFMLLAERLAQTVPADAFNLPLKKLMEAKLSLEKAVYCLNQILKFIPEDEASVPLDAFWTTRGKAIYESEPNRFQKDRIKTVMASYNELLVRLEAVLTKGKETSSTLFNFPSQSSNGQEIHHLEALSYIEIIRAQAKPVLELFASDLSGRTALALKPHHDDYAKVFVDEMAEKALSAYKSIWSKDLDISYPSKDQSQLHIFIAPAGMLDLENELSKHFPLGYRSIAPILNPHRIWLAWKYMSIGQTSGLAFDGLVWLDDHWAWFPKPYRVLVGIILSGGKI